MNLKDFYKPFSSDEIEWRVGSTNKEKTKGLALPYVTNRAIMNRLDDICGQAGWKNEYERWNGSGAKCGISIKIENEWITKYDGADDTNVEPTKGGFSDSMKRAAVQWGMGRYLYEMPQIWVELEGGKYMSKIVKEDLSKRYDTYISKKYKGDNV